MFSRDLVIALLSVGQAKDIVGGRIVEVGELDQNICWNIEIATFIIAVDPLGAVEYFAHTPAWALHFPNRSLCVPVRASVSTRTSFSMR